jgi:hypothetical protein
MTTQEDAEDLLISAFTTLHEPINLSGKSGDDRNGYRGRCQGPDSAFSTSHEPIDLSGKSGDDKREDATSKCTNLL